MRPSRVLGDLERDHGRDHQEAHLRPVLVWLAVVYLLAMEMAATTGFEVSARGRISFNGRMSTEYTDPGVELTAGPLAASDWLRTAP